MYTERLMGDLLRLGKSDGIKRRFMENETLVCNIVSETR
jgi:hypothetical protein